MKRSVFILCLCLLAGGCKPREQKEYASPTEQPEPVILTLAEEPESVVCAMRFEIKPAKVQKVYRDIPLSHELQDAVDNACEEYRVSPEVLYAVMETESGYQVDAQNGQCIGLMQIHTINLPYLGEQIGTTDLSDPVQNIHAGAYLLGGYLQKYNLTDSLMAYNLGEGGAKKKWAQGVHETGYTRKVIEIMERSAANGSV